MTEPQTVKVMVVDDQQLMRDGISSLLSIQEGIEVIGTAANGQEAIEQALVLTPDVILMDVRMPVMNGIAATEQIRRQLSTCQVLMLTTFDDEEDIVKALIAGASGYLLKDIPAQDLAQAVRLAHRGIYQLEPSIAGKLVGALNKQIGSGPAAPTQKESSTQAVAAQFDLTEREMEVLQLIATGATNREIAEELVVSEGTVKNHVSNILSRLGLRDRTQAAIFARENNLL
ncbi:MAG: response regulator transcription factor [Anaerolineae bacterium]|nr:response regulator transcription factor [Anaerolineae bacterium]